MSGRGGAGGRWRWLSAGVMLIPTLVLFWDIVFAGRVLFWGAPLLQFGPWYQAAVDAIRAGELPLWNPLVGNGAPLIANYQSALFYPPNWLHLLVAPAHAMSWLMVLHVMWAGLGTWFYGRVIGLRPFSRMVSVLSFMLSGYLVSRLGFPSIGSALPWLPWLLWAAERLVARPRAAEAAVLGLCLGMQWLSGHAQISFFSGLALSGYLAWRLLAFPREGGRLRAVFRPAAFAGLAAALGFGLAAIQLFPTAELQRLSQRAAGVERGFGMTYSLWPWRLLAFASPRFFGHPATDNYWGLCCNYWEDNGYVGLLPLLLAAGAVVGWVRARITGDRAQDCSGPDSLTPYFLLLSLLALLLAFGVHTPIYPFFHQHVPGFGQFQAPARLLCLWTMGVSMLAGIGAEGWRPTIRARTAARYGIVVGLALLIAAGVLSQMLSGKPLTFVVGLLQLAVSLVLIGALGLRQPHPADEARTFRWEAAVLLFVAADLVVSNWGANPTADGWLYTRGTESAAALREAGQTGRTFYPAQTEYAVTFDHYLSFQSFRPRSAHPDGGAAGTEDWFGLREALLPNLGILDGLPTANNFDPLLPSRHADLVAAVNAADQETRIRLLQMMAVETLVTEQAPAGLPVMHSNDDVVLSAVPEPLPRSYLVFSARPVAGRQQALQAVNDPSFDPSRAVVLESAPSQPESAGSPAVPLSLTATCNSATIRAALPTSGYLVLSDTYYPGWQAFVDGLPATILRANFAFRAVALPAGEHVVEFEYRPVSFRLGAVATALTSLVVLGLLVSEWRKRSPHDVRHSAAS